MSLEEMSKQHERMIYVLRIEKFLKTEKEKILTNKALGSGDPLFEVICKFEEEIAINFPKTHCNTKEFSDSL